MADNAGLDAIIQDQITQTVPDLINQSIMTHTHNGSDSLQLGAGSNSLAPQSAITVAVGGSLSSGGSAVLSSADAAILNNALERIADLQSRLQALALTQ